MKMDINQFRIKVINSLQQEYGNCVQDGEILKIENKSVEVQIPLTQMYQEYLVNKDYEKFFEMYIDNIDQLLRSSEYKINYNMVYPLLRKEDVGGPDGRFYMKPLFEDIHMFFAEDRGDMFRIVSKNDAVDFNKLYECAFQNLNKIVNPLVRIHDNLNIYTLKYNSDIAPSMIFNEITEKQIIKNIGSTFVFSIPTSSTLLVASYNPQNIEILKELIKDDQDPNKITDDIIIYKNGIYRYAK